MDTEFKSNRDKRLAKDFKSIEALCKYTSKIICQPIERNRSDLPTRYQIIYLVKSIIGINGDESPVYGEKHIVEITLPPDYPSEPPICYVKSDIWHPNIRSQKRDKNYGHICVNSKEISAYNGLAYLIRYIGEMLQYKNYLAEEREPRPNDTIVAEWVRRYAEPLMIVDKEKGIAVDNTDIIELFNDETVRKLDEDDGIEIKECENGVRKRINQSADDDEISIIPSS